MLHHAQLRTSNFVPSQSAGFQLDFFNPMDQNFYPYSFASQQPSFDAFKFDEVNQNQFTDMKSTPLMEKNQNFIPKKTFKSPDEMKKHLNRREKNNQAAKESRKKRKQREMDLTNENNLLKNQLKNLKEENEKLRLELEQIKNNSNPFFGASY